MSRTNTSRLPQKRFYDLSTTEPIIAAEFIITEWTAGGPNTIRKKYLLGTGATEAAGLGGALKTAVGPNTKTLKTEWPAGTNTQHEKQ